MTITSIPTDPQIIKWLATHEHERESLHFNAYPLTFDQKLHDDDMQSLVRCLQIIGNACFLNPACTSVDGIEALQFVEEHLGHNCNFQIKQLQDRMQNAKTTQTEHIDTDITGQDFIHWLLINAKESTEKIATALLLTAGEYLDDYSEKNTNYLETLYKVVKIHINERSFKLAEETCKKIITTCNEKPSLNSDNSYFLRACHKMGDIQMSLKRPGNAIFYYNQALILCKQYPNAYAIIEKLEKLRNKAIQSLQNTHFKQTTAAATS